MIIDVANKGVVVHHDMLVARTCIFGLEKLIPNRIDYRKRMIRLGISHLCEAENKHYCQVFFHSSFVKVAVALRGVTFNNQMFHIKNTKFSLCVPI